MESFSELITAIKKPFLFVSKDSYQKFKSVKGLDLTTISLAEKGLSLTNDKSNRDRLKELIVLFQNYSKLDEVEKKQIIKKALSLLDVFDPPVKHVEERPFFNESMHKSLTLDEYLNNEEKLLVDVQYLKGVGPKIAEKFRVAGIRSIKDLLYFFPRRYEDRRKLSKIADLQDGMEATFLAEIEDIHTVYYRGRGKSILDVELKDDTGLMHAKWFRYNKAYFEGKIRIGHRGVFNGKIKCFKGKTEIYHPEFEILGKTEGDSLSFGKIVPVYSETGGLYQKTLRRIMFNAASNYSRLNPCIMPSDICKVNNLLSPQEALSEIHCPDHLADYFADFEENFKNNPCYKSLIFQELLLFNLLIGLKKRANTEKVGIKVEISDKEQQELLSYISFELTKTQKISLDEITDDLKKSQPMNRLLQGDVGSGKTIVALMSAMFAVKKGFQAAFMAPTEILAEQIYKQAKELFGRAGTDVGLLLGAQDEATRTKILGDLKTGKLKMVVGTHALIQKGVDFKDLAFVVVDEQHRFGVLQRGAIRDKGKPPHMLIMSATPIPRTLALTYYGDLDISAIKELPKGRKPIITRVINDQSRSKLYNFIKDEIKNGRQAYIIYPIIEESDKVNLLDATSMSKYLSENIFSRQRVALIHGRIKAVEKERIMEDFRKGKIDILVSTTVIEVGIDVPNATVMVIEHPERFGLSQLHQLRGRVGRGAHKSYCFLLLGIDYDGDIKDRMSVFRNTHDGFLLAEEDLKLRGPGDFFGASQHGLPPFKIAKFPRDVETLKITREQAFELLKNDPELKLKEHALLVKYIKDNWSDKVDLVNIG